MSTLAARLWNLIQERHFRKLNKEKLNDLGSAINIVHVDDIQIIVLNQDPGDFIRIHASVVIDHLQKVIPGGIGSRRLYSQDDNGIFIKLIMDGNGLFLGRELCSQGQQSNLLKLLEKEANPLTE